MAEVNLPPEAQQLLMQLQSLQQQMQPIMMQKESMEIQKIEITRAKEELDKTSDEQEVFKAVGPILIKSNKQDLLKEFAEKTETIDLRLKTFEKQEKLINEKAADIQKKLQEMLTGKKEETKENVAE